MSGVGKTESEGQKGVVVTPGTASVSLGASIGGVSITGQPYFSRYHLIAGSHFAALSANIEKTEAEVGDNRPLVFRRKFSSGTRKAVNRVP